MKKFLFSAVVLAAMASCTKDDIASIEVDSTVVNFGSSEIMTKAYDATWEAGDQVGIYMSTRRGANISVSAANYMYYVAGEGGSSVAFTPYSDAISYTEGSNATFFAYYPYTADMVGTIYPIDVQDQSDLTAIDLMVSDQVSSRTDVQFTFEHKLSKLILNLYADQEGIATLSDLEGGINGMYTTASYDIFNQEFSNYDGENFAFVMPENETAIAAAAIVASELPKLEALMAQAQAKMESDIDTYLTEEAQAAILSIVEQIFEEKGSDFEEFSATFSALLSDQEAIYASIEEVVEAALNYFVFELAPNSVEASVSFSEAAATISAYASEGDAYVTSALDAAYLAQAAAQAYYDVVTGLSSTEEQIAAALENAERELETLVAGSDYIAAIAAIVADASTIEQEGGLAAIFGGSYDNDIYNAYVLYALGTKTLSSLVETYVGNSKADGTLVAAYNAATVDSDALVQYEEIQSTITKLNVMSAINTITDGYELFSEEDIAEAEETLEAANQVVEILEYAAELTAAVVEVADTITATAEQFAGYTYTIAEIAAMLDTDTMTGIEAIVIPQDMSGASFWFSSPLYGDFEIAIPEIEFESGLTYTYNIELTTAKIVSVELE